MNVPLTGIEQRFVNLIMQVTLPAMDPSIPVDDILENEDDLQQEMTDLLELYYGAPVEEGSRLEVALTQQLAQSIIAKTGGAS